VDCVHVCHCVVSLHLLRGFGVDDAGVANVLSPRGGTGSTDLPLPTLRWNTAVELLNELYAAVAAASEDDVTQSFYHPLLSGVVKAFPALLWRLAGAVAAQNSAPIGRKGTVRAIRVTTEADVDVSEADAVVRVSRFLDLFATSPIVFSIAIKAAVIRIAVTPSLHPVSNAIGALDVSLDRLLCSSAAVPPTIHILDHNTVPVVTVSDVEHVEVEIDRSAEAVWKRCQQLFGPSVSSASLKLPWTVRFRGTCFVFVPCSCVL
jgi:hypothetical protein